MRRISGLQQAFKSLVVVVGSDLRIYGVLDIMSDELIITAAGLSLQDVVEVARDDRKISIAVVADNILLASIRLGNRQV